MDIYKRYIYFCTSSAAVVFVCLFVSLGLFSYTVSTQGKENLMRGNIACWIGIVRQQLWHIYNNATIVSFSSESCYEQNPSKADVWPSCQQTGCLCNELQRSLPAALPYDTLHRLPVEAHAHTIFKNTLKHSVCPKRRYRPTLLHIVIICKTKIWGFDAVELGQYVSHRYALFQ